MKELVLLKGNKIVCDSINVAEKFGKRHNNVMRDIGGLLKNEQTKQMFILSNYIEKQNKQTYPMYYMNRDGFSLLAMGFTGEKALEWKIKYIQAFNEMERQLVEHNSSHWQQTRLESKNIRKMETDEIKQLVAYAKAQGSEHAERYYTLFSKLANKAVGIGKDQREQLSVRQLNNLTLVEQIIGEVIRQGMAADLYYKEIYKACSDRLGQFQVIAYLA